MLTLSAVESSGVASPYSFLAKHVLPDAFIVGFNIAGILPGPFRIVPGVSELSTSKETNEFSQDAELVTEFFQTLEDMQFAAPKHQELVDQWSIQIRTGTTTLSIECSLPAEDPTMVIGLIDSSAGYSYFQSRTVFQWYQTYSHRWLEVRSK